MSCLLAILLGTGRYSALRRLFSNFLSRSPAQQGQVPMPSVLRWPSADLILVHVGCKEEKKVQPPLQR